MFLRQNGDLSEKKGDLGWKRDFFEVREENEGFWGGFEGKKVFLRSL